jgi:glycosyltransferase involved in cell wall biosynthesis
LKVSVIIPVKNRAHLLKETLESIVNQSLKPYEVIIVDDHSEDDLQLVLSASQFNITYLKSNRKGPGAARNIGFEKASGDYIQFFDSDDLMTHNKLEIQAEILKKTNADIVYGPFVKASQIRNNRWHQEDVIMQFKPLRNKHSLFDSIAKGWCPITQSVMFTKELVKRTGGWREDIFTHEDLDFWFRVAMLDPVCVHTNETGVLYRQHGIQLTNEKSNIEFFTKNHIQVLKDWRKTVEKKSNFLSRQYIKAKIELAQRSLLENKIGKKSSHFNVLLFRILNKVERSITRSNWERMHGVCASPELFDNIVKKVYTH